MESIQEVGDKSRSDENRSLPASPHLSGSGMQESRSQVAACMNNLPLAAIPLESSAEDSPRDISESYNISQVSTDGLPSSSGTNFTAVSPQTLWDEDSHSASYSQSAGSTLIRSIDDPVFYSAAASVASSSLLRNSNTLSGQSVRSTVEASSPVAQLSNHTSIIDTATGQYLLKIFIDKVAPWVGLSSLSTFYSLRETLLIFISLTCAALRPHMQLTYLSYHLNTVHFVKPS